MNCYICGVEASEGERTGDYQRLACTECGDYIITGTATALLATNGWALDVELVREWLQAHQGTGVVPVIDSNVAARLAKAK